MAYKMRGLPCRDASGASMPWSVCGVEKITLLDGTKVTGGGVLEWCWDREDAQMRLELMKQDSRFSQLTVRQEET